jgi:hypothetical protein
LDLNFNPHESQRLQGTVLMPSRLFLSILFVILVSNNADFDLSPIAADGRTAGRDPVDHLQLQFP